MVLGKQGISVALLAVAGLVFCAVLLTAAPSQAQDLDCPDFDFQEDAQDELDKDRSDPNGLDRDKDGIACETLPHRDGGGGNETGRSVVTNENEDEADEDDNDDEAEDDNEPTLASSQQNGGSGSSNGVSASGSSAVAGGATAQSSSQDRRRRNVIKGTIPKKRLPPTGGVPTYLIVTGSILTGTSLLALGVVVRR